MAWIKSDLAFRGELIVEATNAFLMDDMETGKALLRDYLNATESIADIARELQVNEKSLRRMLADRELGLEEWKGVLQSAWSAGIPHVLVGGVFVVRNGALVEGVSPGRPVRRRPVS